jgi:2-acylglycerol O-acyltransferase 2
MSTTPQEVQPGARSPSPVGEERREAAAESRPSPAASPSAEEKVAVQKPTRKSLSAHVASTIHYLASEVSSRGRGTRSNSNTSRGSHASSQVSEPPLTHARPPASPEEVDEQLDRILYAVDQLQQLQRRGRYIAAREVRNLRRAFLFAVGEEQLYREAVMAETEGGSVTSTASSAPATPSLTAKKPPRKTKKQRARKAGSTAPLEQPPHESVSLPCDKTGKEGATAEMPKEGEKTSRAELSGVQKASSSDTPVRPWLMEADPPANSACPLSPPPPPPPPLLPTTNRKFGETAAEYSPKAAAADRLLRTLEQYVEKTPTSASFDMSGAHFSWSSIIHTPGERRLQSLVMSLFIFFTGIPICLAISFLLMLSRYTAPFMVLYIIWMFTFGRPSHPHAKNTHFTRFFLWRYYRDYFPIRLVVRKEVRRRFDRERNYFFAYHPHGIHTFGALLNFGVDSNDLCDLLPGITVHLQTLKVNLFVPFWRQLTIWMGCGDASASCIRKTLRSGPGQSIMLVVGGAEESLMAKPNANDLLLLKRKGFIKIALQEGTPLVPVYGFGENNVYNVADLASEPEVQHLLGLLKHYLGFAIPLVKGRGFFNFNYGVLPHRRPIVVVVGEPIEVPRIAKPTAQDLNKWQAKYIEGLQKLYDEHRGIYDLEATGLRIMR